MQANCEVDFRDFPDDTSTCRFFMNTNIFPSLVKMVLKVGEGTMDTLVEQTNWDIPRVELTLVAGKNDSDHQLLVVTLEAKRRSSTLKLELTLPMVICTILVLISPLFGTFHRQLTVKLFSLLLQFMCFQFLVQKTPQVGVGQAMPNICEFSA